MKCEQVNANRNEHANVKGDPKPDARRHGGQSFTRLGSRQSQIARPADATYTSHTAHLSPKWTLNYKS
jgi:hypothetical protein